MIERRLPSRRVAAVTLACIALALAAIIAGAVFHWRYYVTSVIVIALSMAPFFVSFESRRPQAREVVAIAVVCALAVASRLVFIAVPHVKPLVGIVMIAGMAFGPQTGFLVGATSGLVSNFLFGQGPWTPWQMLAFGVAGLIAGALVRGGLVPRGGWSLPQRLAVSVIGFLTIVCVTGPLLDTSSLFIMVSSVTPESAAAIYLAGLLTANIPHGVATFATLFLLGNPLLKKIDRVCVKYGLME